MFIKRGIQRWVGWFQRLSESMAGTEVQAWPTMSTDLRIQEFVLLRGQYSSAAVNHTRLSIDIHFEQQNEGISNAQFYVQTYK